MFEESGPYWLFLCGGLIPVGGAALLALALFAVLPVFVAPSLGWLLFVPEPEAGALWLLLLLAGGADPLKHPAIREARRKIGRSIKTLRMAISPE
jgi:hypothetical protein